MIDNKNCLFIGQFAEGIESRSTEKTINMLFHSLST